MTEVPFARQGTGFALALGTLGVVFGDIGTSPLYALQIVFSIDHNSVKPTPADVFGVISMVIWSIAIVVSVKYVVLIMRADNDGEGGILALVALLREKLPFRRRSGCRHGARHDRRGSFLRRQRYHPGDLGDVRDRGSRRGQPLP